MVNKLYFHTGGQISDSYTSSVHTLLYTASTESNSKGYHDQFSCPENLWATLYLPANVATQLGAGRRGSAVRVVI